MKTCKDCTSRHLWCHHTCEVYKEMIKRNEEIKKNRRKYLDVANCVNRQDHIKNKAWRRYK